MIRAVVTQASPSVRVIVVGAATSAPARVVSRGDSWSPAVGAVVLVELVGRTLFIVGAI